MHTSDLPAIWNAVIEKASVTGFDSLSRPERAVYSVNAFLVDLENGGVSEALYNASGRIQVVSDAFTTVGDVLAASALREAASLLESPTAHAATTWSECLRVTGAETRLPEWRRHLSQRIQELYGALEAFTQAHLSDLPTSTSSA